MAVYKCPHHAVWVDSAREQACPQCLAEGGSRAKQARKRNQSPPSRAVRPNKARSRASWLVRLSLLLGGASLLALPSVQSLLRDQGFEEVADRAERVASKVESMADEVESQARSAADTLGVGDPEPGADAAQASPFALPAQRLDLLTTHTAGRSGVAWLPPRDPGEPRPLLVWLHPAGQDGSEALELLRDLAERYRFAILAPTSHRGPGAPGSFEVWDTGKGKALSDDDHHVLDCVAELLESGHFTLNGDRALLLGVAGGGSSALRLATLTPRFSHFAIVHEAPSLQGLGARQPQGYLVAGARDAVRRESRIKLTAEQLRGLGYPIRFVVGDAAHPATPAELEGVVQWWLSAAP